MTTPAYRPFVNRRYDPAKDPANIAASTGPDEPTHPSMADPDLMANAEGDKKALRRARDLKQPASVLFGVCRNCGKAIRTMPTTMLWRHDSNGYSNCPSTTLAEPRIEVTDEDRVRAQQDHQSCVRGLHSWTDHLPGRPDANANSETPRG